MSLTEIQKNKIQAHIGLQTQLQSLALEEHFLRASRPEYWLSVVPEMSIESPDAPFHVPALTRACPEATAGLRLAKHGYTRLGSFHAPEWMEHLRRGIDRIRQQGWPPIFCLVYDDFWRFLAAGPVLRIIESQTGPRTKIGRAWAHFVHSSAGAGGYAPASDKPSARENSITFWFSLTDFQVSSGCLCLLPVDLVPNTMQREFGRNSEREVAMLLQSVRPLPSAAGELLCFRSALTHWMTTREANGSSVMGILITVQSVEGDEDSHSMASPLGTAALPGFRERLKIIAGSIQQHAKTQPLICKYLPLADRLATFGDSAHGPVSALKAGMHGNP